MPARLLTLIVLACAASANAAEIVAADTWLVAGVTRTGVQPDGNSIILQAPGGLIVFDTGRHAEHTQKLIDFAQARNEPIKVIINSHWHLDHVGGNVLLRRAYPEVQVYASVALSGALTGFLADYREQLVAGLAQTDEPAVQTAMRNEIALIDAGPMLAPTYVVRASGLRTLAGRDMRLNYERAAVTAGDVWAYDPKTRVVLAGDLVTLPAPFLDTACPTRWRAALRRLAATRFQLLVPGHGAPMDHAGLQTYRTAFDALLSCAASDAPKDACIDGWMRDAATLVPAADEDYARRALDYYMDQVLRGHDARVRALCAA